MFCPNCGFQSTDTARFCGKCGFAFAQSNAASAPGFSEPPRAPDPPRYADPSPAGPSVGPREAPAQTAAQPRPITPEMMNAQWYYQVAQLVYGPLNSAAVLKLLNEHVLNFDSPVKLVPSPAFPSDSGWVPMNRTMLMDIYYSGAWSQSGEADVFKSGVNAIKNTINTITGDGGKLDISFSKLFSDVFKKHTAGEADQLFISGTSLTTPPESSISSGWPKPWLFSRVFILLAATFGILWFSLLAFGNVAGNMLPGLIFMGALAVPFSVAVFFWEINVPRNIGFFEIMKVFFIGGTISLVVSLFLDIVLNNTGELTFAGATVTGIVEETAKCVAVLIFLRSAKTKYVLNGLLIGAACGAGFAVFESAGYALNKLLESDFNLSYAVNNIFLRAVLSVGGHVVWAAITGAAIVMAKNGEPLASKHIFSGKFLQLFIVPVILHAVWDMPIYFDERQGIDAFCPVQVLLTVIVWFFVIKLINGGLRQIEETNKRQAVS